MSEILNKLELTESQAKIILDELDNLGIKDNDYVEGSDLKKIFKKAGIKQTIPNNAEIEFKLFKDMATSCLSAPDAGKGSRKVLKKKKKVEDEDEEEPKQKTRGKEKKTENLRSKTKPAADEEKVVKENFEDTEYLGDIKNYKSKMNPKEYDDIKVAFSYLDKDSSKKISRDELENELSKVKDEIKEQFPEFDVDTIVDMILEKADENGDNQIDLNEFYNIMSQEPINDLKIRKNCDKVYKQFTRDGDLNAKNLKTIAKELKIDDDDEMIEKMIFYADTDGDKKISEDEFYYILNPKEGQIEEMAIEWRDLNKGKEEGKKEEIKLKMKKGKK